MDIKVNTDSHITGSEGMFEKYAIEVKKKLDRYTEYIMSVDVYFADENRGKSGVNDKRCTIEVRPKGKHPEAVSHNADTLAHAFNGAVDKIRSVMDTVVGKLHNK